MASWSSRLFFFGMVAFLIYVIMIGDGPKWKALFTQKSPSVSTNAGQTGATGTW